MKVVTRQEVISEARSWVGTKFYHQGRTKGEFVDCAGLIIGTAKNLGLSDFDELHYGEIPVPSRMEAILDEHLDRVPSGSEQPGDIFWMKDIRVGGRPRHVGFLSEANTIIHADPHAGQGGLCIEQQFDVDRRRAVVRWYSLRGVAPWPS